MSFVSSNYESIFRVDGKPILPPVITDERRIELQRYKSLAIGLENRLRANRKSKPSNSTELEIVGNSGDFGRRESDAYSVSTVKSGNDVVGNSPNERKDSNVTAVTDTSFFSAEKFSIEDTKFEANDSPRSLHLDINSMGPANAASEMLSPSFSLHSSPSLGALNDVKNQTLYLTPYSIRDSPETDFGARKLIRSNSYTLDTPSPLLLQLMEANGINANNSSPPKTTASSQPSLATKDKTPPLKHAWTGTPTKIAVRKSPSLVDVKTSKVNPARKSNSPASSVREPPKKELIKPKSNFVQRKSSSARYPESVLRSIYDSGLSSRSATKPKKCPISTAAISGKTTVRIEKPPQKPVIAPELNPVDFQRILKMIEEQHSTQMNALMERQKEEQKRMQEEFARQQDMLVKQISHLVLPALDSANDSVSSNLSKSIPRNNSFGSVKINTSADGGGYDSTDNDDIVGRDHNGNQLNRSRINRKNPTPESLKCMRRLVYYDDNEMVSTDLCESNQKQRHEPYDGIQPLSSDNEESFRIRNDAATVITAYAKGYLTRRLFKTVKVQNIVKTIKDTLLFILDIHFENPVENDTPADLKLKTHLIQQLTSACYNLHNIFVNYSVTERLDMIARDREWLQAKFNRSKISDSFNSQQHRRMILNGHIPAARMEKMLL